MVVVVNDDVEPAEADHFMKLVSTFVDSAPSGSESTDLITAFMNTCGNIFAQG